MTPGRKVVRCLGTLVLVGAPFVLGTGCGPAALLLMSAAGGAAAVSGEPQRLYNTQGRDFNEEYVSQIHSGVHTPADIVGLFGHPQTKTFTAAGEEWAYRHYIPPSLLRPGSEKLLTVRFREGKVAEVRFSVSAL
jgi:hypothetical protein